MERCSELWDVLPFCRSDGMTYLNGWTKASQRDHVKAFELQENEKMFHKSTMCFHDRHFLFHEASSFRGFDKVDKWIVQVLCGYDKSFLWNHSKTVFICPALLMWRNNETIIWDFVVVAGLSSFRETPLPTWKHIYPPFIRWALDMFQDMPLHPCDIHTSLRTAHVNLGSRQIRCDRGKCRCL